MAYQKCMSWVFALVLSLIPVTQIAAGELADGLYDYFIDGASLTLGVGTRQAGLKVIRKSDGAEGKVVQRDEEAYFLSYSTKPIFLDDHPDVGFTFMFNVSNFKADKQETSRDVFEDLGTRASGEFIYVVPTVFYQWGEHRYDGRYTRIGVGLGIGLARFDGNVVLTSTPGQDIVSVSNTKTDLKLASSFMLESRWKHWGLRLSVAGPVIENDEYEIQVEDIAIHLGYSFVF